MSTQKTGIKRRYPNISTWQQRFFDCAYAKITCILKLLWKYTLAIYSLMTISIKNFLNVNVVSLENQLCNIFLIAVKNYVKSIRNIY